MTPTRKRYDRQFKTAAAQVVVGREKPIRELAEELDIKDSTLRRRAQEYERMGAKAFLGNGSPKINRDYEILEAREAGRGTREGE
jgi:transposase